MAKDPKTGEGEYEQGNWNDPFQGIDAEVPDRKLFDFDLFNPKTKKLQTLPGQVSQECPPLVDYEQDKVPGEGRTLWQGKINQQAHGENRIIQPVLDVLSIDHTVWPKVGALIDTIMTNIRYPLFRYKVEYARARPHHKSACSDLHPMYMPTTHPLYPGHGAFPSGHATFAYFWAFFLARFTTDTTAQQRLLDAAMQVATNRERAGLHFRSDSGAGKELGEKIAAAMFDAMTNSSVKDPLTTAQVQLILNAR